MLVKKKSCRINIKCVLNITNQHANFLNYKDGFKNNIIFPLPLNSTLKHTLP